LKTWKEGGSKDPPLHEHTTLKEGGSVRGRLYANGQLLELTSCLRPASLQAAAALA